MSALASRLGGYVQAYTLYSSVRPFGVSAIVAGWDSEEDSIVDAEVGFGPKAGSGGKHNDPAQKRGGPGLYMVEPSGLYWVSSLDYCFIQNLISYRAIMEQLLAKGDKQQKLSSRSSI